ncbi:hypothetical protein JCM10207_008126, partial [Rhodosporidiobolus poonsookiae]
ALTAPLFLVLLFHFHSARGRGYDYRTAGLGHLYRV